VKLAALNDLKLTYVEVVNPLLSKRLLSVVRRMPDELRSEKLVFKQIIRSKLPEIPFAERPAISSQAGILQDKRVRDYLAQRLDSDKARSLLPAEIIDHALRALKNDARYRNGLHRRIGALVGAAKRRIVKTNKLVLNDCLFAFRAYMIVRMNQILETDATSLGP
jgi:hypothetical protein